MQWPTKNSLICFGDLIVRDTAHLGCTYCVQPGVGHNQQEEITTSSSPNHNRFPLGSLLHS